jgi:hypothetical protein
MGTFTLGAEKEQFGVGRGRGPPRGRRGARRRDPWHRRGFGGREEQGHPGGGPVLAPTGLPGGGPGRGAQQQPREGQRGSRLTKACNRGGGSLIGERSRGKIQ